MNERFQQILKQSTNPPWDGEQGPMNEFNLEKFAELIVRECMDICKHDSDDDDDQFYLGRVYQAKEITQLIKKHFGVEE